MKNVKNLIAVVALVGVLGVGSSFAAELTADRNDSNQQYSQPAESWFDGLFNRIKVYLTGDDKEVVQQPNPELNKLAVNHNETLVRDEN